MGRPPKKEDYPAPPDGVSFASLDTAAFHLILIALLGIFAYSNTFNAPFQFDDEIDISSNPLIRNVSNIPLMLAGTEGFFSSRPLMNVTLALNYYLGGMDTTGYHVVNIALHIINGLLLYLLVVVTGRQLGYEKKAVRTVALMSSALFVVHPIQTEAVTYIVSRSVLLATAFCLLGIILFLKAAISEKRRGLYIAGLFFVSLLGMASREDFAIFPAILLLYDLFFISRFRLKAVAGHWKAYLSVFLSLGYMAHLVVSNTYDKAADHPSVGVSHIEYALTQFNAHWTYLRLLLLPVNQNLDFDYPISKTFFEFPTILSFPGYLSLWAGGVLLARKRPYMAFSILWFLIALLPISFGVTFMKSLKLDDVIFEHRLYLPGVAFYPLAAAGIFHAREKIAGGGRGALLVFLSVILVLVLASAAFARNMAWRSKISLWGDVVKKSPEKARGHTNLGIAYVAAGLFDEAIEHYRIALKLEPDQADAHNNLGRAYKKKGLTDQAIEEYRIAINLKPDFAMAYDNLGTAYYSKGLTDQAIEEYQAALKLNPDFALAHYNLGTAYASKGSRDKAIDHFLIALRLKPDFADVHYNLGVMYFQQGVMDKARREFEAALRLNPADHEAKRFIDRLGNR